MLHNIIRIPTVTLTGRIARELSSFKFPLQNISAAIQYYV